MRNKGKTLGCIGVIITFIGLAYNPLLIVGASLCCIGIIYDSFEEEGTLVKKKAHKEWKKLKTLNKEKTK